MNKPVLLTIADLELHQGGRTILDKISFSIHQGEKVGLLGRNGSGKTSLLKIISGTLQKDAGRIEKKRDLTIGYLPQEFHLETDKTVYENLRLGAQDILDLIEEYDSLPGDSERKQELYDEIAYLDGWDLDHRINALINQMKLPPKDTLITSFSGGEKRRLALAKAIVGNPDLLILDEPTNHLDIENVTWLENFLVKYDGACLFVTHDRYFLDRIATKMIELVNGKLHTYSGNYTDFLIQKADRIEIEEKTEHNRQKYLNKELAWMARSPQGRTTKSKGRIQRYESLAEQDKPHADLDVEMIIPTPPKLSDRILDTKKLGYTIQKQDRVLFNDINIQFQKGMRLGIVGRNGAGKSTFLKILLGQIQPTSGSVDIAARTEINYADQEKLTFHPEDTVIKAMSDSIEMVSIAGKMVPTRAYLKRFLFNDRQLSTQIKNLSGGERSRLILAKILKAGGNFLILDEPTNDLDLSTLRVLEEAINSFDGCVIIVSHDRYFLNRTCTHILGFEDEGKTRLLAGDYDLYMKIKSGTVSTNSETGEINPIKKFDKEEKKEIQHLEKQIEYAEAEVKKREAPFFEPDFYVKKGDKIDEYTAQLKTAKDKLARLYKEWEEMVG
jgi:ATP-binding cassette subfamily F protein uup